MPRGRHHRRSRRGHRRRPHRGGGYFPVYTYPYYGYDPYLDNVPSQEPPYVIVQEEKDNSAPLSYLHFQIPTIVATLLLSYILWGRGGV